MDNNKQIFSVIIPVYNGAETIEQSLSSLVPSREYIKEVIVCDDRSTDNCIDLAHQFDNMLPMVYTRVDDSLPHGPGNARNAGLEIATGDWVTFLDCDDMFPITAFVDVYNSLLLNKQEKVVEVISSFYQYTIEYNVFTIMRNEDPSYVHGYFYNKSFLDAFKIRFDPDIFIIEDGYFNLLANATILNENLNVIRNPQTIGYYWCIHVDHQGLSYFANPKNQEDTNHTIKARTKAVSDIIKRYGTMSPAGQYARKITIDSLLSAYFEYVFTKNSNAKINTNGLLKWDKKILDVFKNVFEWDKAQVIEACSEETNFQAVKEVYQSHFGEIEPTITLEEFYDLIDSYEC